MRQEIASYEIKEKEREHNEGDNTTVNVLRYLGGAKGVAKGTYDKVFDFQNDQNQVYEFIEPSISKVTEGFNCSIFAYGQTGSGKTYTMFGPNWEEQFYE